jgi:DNA-binding NarL/FixJ family response regulator
MSGRISGVILIAPYGRMLASLRVLLKSLFPLIQIERTEDFPTAMQLLAVKPPWLVLIDADLPGGEGWRIGNEVKQKFPGHHLLILAHHACQKEQACIAGLNALLLEGLTAADLADAIDACPQQ